MAKSTILIVDDEAVGRKTLKALLIGQGYDLAFAEDGPETLVKAAELTPDVILLDVMMPGMNGFEVCRRLRADPLLAEAPVIMVTALDDHNSLLQGIEAGADDFISKPFNRAELRARVRTITRLNRYRRLMTERTKFEWAVQGADDGYLMLNGDGTARYANPQARLYLDLPLDASMFISDAFLGLVQNQYRLEPQAAWAVWPAEVNSPRYLVRPESPTAHAFWLQVDALALPAGSEMGWIVRLRDVTTQMALQRDMYGFHEMIAHKLRTPLTSMLGSLRLLARRASKLSSDQITQFSEMALAGAERLHGDIEDILRYLEAPDQARSSAKFCLAQLSSLVDEISAALELESVTVSGHEALGDVLLALSQRAVELMLWEVLENAKKFHPQQSPQVAITLALVTPQELRIHIHDDGLTLSPEQLAQVWTPYYQGEKDFTGESPGIGLGLPLVAALVWESGGMCSISNRKDGPGVLVELVLPLASDQQDAREQTSADDGEINE